LTPDRKPNPKELKALKQQGTLSPRPGGVTCLLFQDSDDSDFFDPRDLVQVKYEMVRRAQIDQESVSQAAAEFGFSRPAFYQAQSAFQRQGGLGLVPRKRGPRRPHKLTEPVMDFVGQTRASQPSLGFVKLAGQLEEKFGLQVHPRSLERRLVQRQKKRS
jgi:transposase